jgi:nucleoside-diphosphate-sugar epimerase
MLLVDGGQTPGGFVYVDDVCDAMLLAAQSQQAPGQAYNISSVDGLTWKAYTSAMAASMSLPAPWLQLPFHAAMALAAASEVPHRLGLPGRPLLTRHATFLLGRDQQYSTAKAQEQLGWQPRVTLGEGLSRSLAECGR